MKSDSFDFAGRDGVALHVWRWLPDTGEPRALLLVAHGMGEHGARYARLAETLTGQGVAVWAPDLRAHGRSVRSDADLGDAGEADTWNACVADLEALLAEQREAHPGLPQILLGHSMGSFLAQQLLPRVGGSLAGAVLSGSSFGTPFAPLARLAARFDRWRRGPRAPSRILEQTFARFNAPFAPARTDFDWLSRDPEEVDRYVADPHCGFVLRTQGFCDMLEASREIGRASHLARIPSALPVYVFSGELDPVHGKLRGIAGLLRAYRRAGLERVESRIYRDGRHEMLNESNRDEVTADLVAWLDRTLPAT